MNRLKRWVSTLGRESGHAVAWGGGGLLTLLLIIILIIILF